MEKKKKHTDFFTGFTIVTMVNMYSFIRSVHKCKTFNTCSV